MRNFLWCYYRWFITSLALEKCKKKNTLFFKLFWYKVSGMSANKIRKISKWDLLKTNKDIAPQVAKFYRHLQVWWGGGRGHKLAQKKIRESGLDVAPCGVANATSFYSMATKFSRLVTNLAPKIGDFLLCENVH